MSYAEERRLKPLSNGSRAMKARDNRHLKKADERAKFLHQCIKFVCDFQGGCVLAHRALTAAIEANEITGFALRGATTIPNLRTVADWRAQWKDKRPTLATTSPKYCRKGIPRNPIDPRLRQFVENNFAHGTIEVTVLRDLAAEKAVELNLPKPSEHRIATIVRGAGHGGRVAAVQGQRAVLLDAVVHGAVPAAYPHQVWYLDELDVPVFVRGYSPITERAEAVVPTACLITDGASGVAVNLHLINPLQRPSDEQRIRGFNANDVRSALAGAFFPELALPACRPYAGWAPKFLRLDNHKAHAHVAGTLRAVGIDVPKLPYQDPRARGQVEAMVKLMKRAMEPLLGSTKHWRVAEHARESQTVLLRKASGTIGRVNVRSNITVQQLMSMEELQEKLNALVQTFHEGKPHTRHKMTRRAKYDLTLRPELIAPGRDIIKWLEGKVLTVRHEGFSVAHEKFTANTAQASFQRQERVQVRIDPGLRGIFVQDEQQQWVFMPRAREFAATQSAENVAHGQHQEASMYGAISRAARASRRASHLTPEGAEHADAVARMRPAEKAAVDAAHTPKRKSPRRAAASAAPMSATVQATAGGPSRPPQSTTHPPRPLSPPPTTKLLRGMRTKHHP